MVITEEKKGEKLARLLHHLTIFIAYKYGWQTVYACKGGIIVRETPRSEMNRRVQDFCRLLAVQIAFLNSITMPVALMMPVITAAMSKLIKVVGSLSYFHAASIQRGSLNRDDISRQTLLRVPREKRERSFRPSWIQVHPSASFQWREKRYSAQNFNEIKEN